MLKYLVLGIHAILFNLNLKVFICRGLEFTENHFSLKALVFVQTSCFLTLQCQQHYKFEGFCILYHSIHLT